MSADLRVNLGRWQESAMDGGDKRADCMSRCVSYIVEKHPKVFIIENVKGILTVDKGRAAEFIKGEIERCGKSSTTTAFCAMSVGRTRSRNYEIKKGSRIHRRKAADDKTGVGSKVSEARPRSQARGTKILQYTPRSCDGVAGYTCEYLVFQNGHECWDRRSPTDGDELETSSAQLDCGFSVVSSSMTVKSRCERRAMRP